MDARKSRLGGVRAIANVQPRPPQDAQVPPEALEFSAWTGPWSQHDRPFVLTTVPLVVITIGA